MRVERNPDGAFHLIPDPGERIAWSSRVGEAATGSFVGGKDVVRFLPLPFYWFGTTAERPNRNPRQWRLYVDGTLVEGPKGSYSPNIHFPAWPDEPAPPAGKEAQ